jgi:hypothetical protein
MAERKAANQDTPRGGTTTSLRLGCTGRLCLQHGTDIVRDAVRRLLNAEGSSRPQVEAKGGRPFALRSSGWLRPGESGRHIGSANAVRSASCRSTHAGQGVSLPATVDPHARESRRPSRPSSVSARPWCVGWPARRMRCRSINPIRSSPRSARARALSPSSQLWYFPGPAQEHSPEMVRVGWNSHGFSYAAVDQRRLHPVAIAVARHSIGRSTSDTGSSAICSSLVTVPSRQRRHPEAGPPAGARLPSDDGHTCARLRDGTLPVPAGCRTRRIVRAALDATPIVDRTAVLTRRTWGRPSY